MLILGISAWIKDLSGLFGSEEIYIDKMHTNERGNEVIAEKIFNEIIPILKEDKNGV